MTIKQTTFRFI